MSDIEDDVKAAIEEFGERAFERFIRDRNIVIVGGIGWINLLSNSELDFKIGLKLKPLPELFAHDVKVYGDNAYLMWEWLGGNFSRKFKNNADVHKTLNIHIA